MCAGSSYLYQCDICHGSRSLFFFPETFFGRFLGLGTLWLLLSKHLCCWSLFLSNHIHLEARHDLLEAWLALSSIDYHRNVQVSILLNEWWRKLCFDQLNCPLSKLHRCEKLPLWNQKKSSGNKSSFSCVAYAKKGEKRKLHGRQRRNEKVNGNVICLHG